MKRQQLVCLQIHNDYQIPGGETKTAVGIANLLEKNNITVIRYYKDNKSFAQKGKINRIIVGIKSIYNKDTVEDIEKIIDKYHIDFALIHNVLPIISNSVYKVLYKYNIPVIKYIQNYNLVCLNGALDHGDKCEKCKKHSCRTGIKCKCYKNSFMYTLIRYMCKRQFDRNYLNQISAFMPNSNFVKNRHAEYGMKTDKMHVMYNYIECDTNEISERNHNSYYLYFGRISKEKGIFTIVEAFKKLDNLQLVFMGMGEDESKLKEVIKGQNNIAFIGSKSGEELKDTIGNAKCVLVPSEWDEPLPRTILESYACGVPVIGSDRGGITEMIKDGTGYTFSAGDSEDLIRVIDKFESINIDDYGHMRDACKSECKNVYSQEMYFLRFKECLRDIGVVDIKGDIVK